MARCYCRYATNMETLAEPESSQRGVSPPRPKATIYERDQLLQKAGAPLKLTIGKSRPHPTKLECAKAFGPRSWRSPTTHTRTLTHLTSDPDARNHVVVCLSSWGTAHEAT